MTFIASVVIASNIMSTTPAEVISSQSYIVPTTIAAEAQPAFEWRVTQHRRTSLSRPLYIGEEQYPTVSARSAIIMDVETKDILWQKNPDDLIPPASITKLMTALVWSDVYEGDMQAEYAFTEEDLQTEPGSKDLLLPVESTMTVEDLFATMLIGSYNDAALALAHSTGLTTDAFVEQMNQKARAIGMRNTKFVDPTGLSSKTVSSAYDIALLASTAAIQPQIQELLGMPEKKVHIIDADYDVFIQTTDELLADPELNLVGGKTGYTDEAGYCFVSIARDPVTNRMVAVAVLGAPDEDARFIDTKTLFNWAFENYQWNN